jgi:glutamate N-acetyltransferase / amino-acid N-acetyltransferase
VSVTAAKGFAAAGTACGIKTSGASDLALVATSDGRPVAAAGVFTQNLACAAPVQISRRHLADGRAAAVILNSGNANAATGENGRTDALRMCELAAEAVGCATTDVLVCSTGLIGIPLVMAPIESGVPALGAALDAGAQGGADAATAIMTTDTMPKQTVLSFEIDDCSITVGGMAKGAAMLAPAMATMLAVLTTDAAVEPPILQTLLANAVDQSFNTLCVDACTSTNDTVLVLASGAAGNPVISGPGPAADALGAALTAACAGLAHQMAADAEGATKLVHLVVQGAGSDADARLAARKVASSQLVQCSLYGRDPYWGRVLSELGTSGAAFDPEQVDISYQGIMVCRDGIAAHHDAAALAAAMKDRDLEIVCDLGAGTGTAEILFTDLTHAYVDENMGTS